MRLACVARPREWRRTFCVACATCGVRLQSDRGEIVVDLDGTPFTYYCSVACARKGWR